MNQLRRHAALDGVMSVVGVVYREPGLWPRAVRP